MSKKSEIKIQVEVNENNLPIDMKWTAQDGKVDNQPASAFLLSIWDPAEKNTMKIDLWTNDMTIEEMKQFFHQTLVAMADTFQRATADEKMADTMRDFCDYFAEKMELKAK